MNSEELRKLADGAENLNEKFEKYFRVASVENDVSEIVIYTGIGKPVPANVYIKYLSRNKDWRVHVVFSECSIYHDKFNKKNRTRGSIVELQDLAKSGFESACDAYEYAKDAIQEKLDEVIVYLENGGYYEEEL